MQNQQDQSVQTETYKQRDQSVQAEIYNQICINYLII